MAGSLARHQIEVEHPDPVGSSADQSVHACDLHHVVTTNGAIILDRWHGSIEQDRRGLGLWWAEPLSDLWGHKPEDEHQPYPHHGEAKENRCCPVPPRGSVHALHKYAPRSPATQETHKVPEGGAHVLPSGTLLEYQAVAAHRSSLGVATGGFIMSLTAPRDRRRSCNSCRPSGSDPGDRRSHPRSHPSCWSGSRRCPPAHRSRSRYNPHRRYRSRCRL